MDFDLLIQDLIRDEGLRTTPYKDTVGKLTIGIGRNLDDVGITYAEAIFLAKNDIARVAAQLSVSLPWWGSLSEVRQRVLANMAFNMGINGLLKFKNALNAMQAGKFDDAATEMLQSQWATQVGVRATHLADQMRAG